jgi:hypothetical protein
MADQQESLIIVFKNEQEQVLEFCGHSVPTQLTILEFMAKYPKWQRIQKTKSVVTKQSIGDYASVCIAGYTFVIKCYVSAAEPYVWMQVCLQIHGA